MLREALLTGLPSTMMTARGFGGLNRSGPCLGTERLEYEVDAKMDSARVAMMPVVAKARVVVITGPHMTIPMLTRHIADDHGSRVGIHGTMNPVPYDNPVLPVVSFSGLCHCKREYPDQYCQDSSPRYGRHGLLFHR